MSFIEAPRFPECVSLGAEGGPGFLTDVVAVASSFEYRNQAREKALGRWIVAHNVLRPEEYEPLRAFFYITAGQANGFRFKDHTDFEVVAGDGVMLLITGNLYQMWKRYIIGATQYLRKIQKPVAGTVTLAPSGATIDYTTGIANTGGGAVPTTWIGEFDVPARFGTDEMKAETITRNRNGILLIGWRAIPIVEIRV